MLIKKKGKEGTEGLKRKGEFFFGRRFHVTVQTAEHCGNSSPFSYNVGVYKEKQRKGLGFLNLRRAKTDF